MILSVHSIYKIILFIKINPINNLAFDLIYLYTLLYSDQSFIVKYYSLIHLTNYFVAILLKLHFTNLSSCGHCEKIQITSYYIVHYYCELAHFPYLLAEHYFEFICLSFAFEYLFHLACLLPMLLHMKSHYYKPFFLDHV